LQAYVSVPNIGSFPSPQIFPDELVRQLMQFTKMNIIEAILAALFLGIPLWFVAKAWRSYLRLDVNSGGRSFQTRIGLALISVSAAMWIAVLVLISLQDYSRSVWFLARKVSPMVLGFINIVLCVVAFVCSETWRNSAQDNTALKRSIGISSGVLILVWLFLVANPH
jgi:uncharacterized protein YacL